MKRFTFLSILMIVAIALSVLTSCSKSGGSDNIETIVYSGNKCTIPMTFEESISHATAIVRAEFVKHSGQFGAYDHLEFRPIEYIKGTPTGNNVFLACFRGTTTLCDENGSSLNESYREADRCGSYIAGKEYLLLLYEVTTVYDDHDVFISLANSFIPRDDPNSATLYADGRIKDYSKSQADFVESYESMCRYVADIAANSPVNTPTEYFVRSMSLNDITAGSTYIFRVKALEKKYEIAENNSEGYSCLVIAELKGTAGSETIKVQFRKDSRVTPGKEYLILVTKIDNSVGFYVSSRNSVFPVTDTATVTRIENLIGDTAR